MSKPLSIERLIHEAEQLHSAPGVAQSLLSLIKSPDFDIGEVVGCLERDPALSARLLRVLNSARYGLRQPVKNLRQAVLYLGQRTLRLMILTFSLQNVFSRGAAQSLYTQYWQQTLTMALAGLKLANRSQVVGPHDAYTAGLLSHIGILLLAQCVSETYLPIFHAARSGSELVEAERNTLGFDHAELGAALLAKWGLPDDLVNAVGEHHQAEPDDFARLVHAGDLLGDVLWKPGTTSIHAAQTCLENHFGIDFDAFIGLAYEVKEEVRIEAEIYGITLEKTVDCERLLESARKHYFELAVESAMDLDSLGSIVQDSTSV